MLFSFPSLNSVLQIKTFFIHFGMPMCMFCSKKPNFKKLQIRKKIQNHIKIYYLMLITKFKFIPNKLFIVN